MWGAQTVEADLLNLLADCYIALGVEDEAERRNVSEYLRGRIEEVAR